MGQHSFQEVMRQWQRMCKSMQEKNMSCKENCPLGHNPTCGELEYASPEEINNAETAIMQWTAEHPEPVYPTWMEWLHDLGLIVQKDGTFTEYKPNEIFSITKKVDALTIKGYDPIPADIAQKLGIEPKEG